MIAIGSENKSSYPFGVKTFLLLCSNNDLILGVAWMSLLSKTSPTQNWPQIWGLWYHWKSTEKNFFLKECVWQKDSSIRKLDDPGFNLCLCACSVALCNCMDGSPPGSSVHGILQTRRLKWVAISFSRESSWARDRTCISCIAGKFFTAEPPRKPQNLLIIDYVTKMWLNPLCWKGLLI